MTKAEEILRFIENAAGCKPGELISFIKHDPMTVYRWRTKRYVIKQDAKVTFRGTFFKMRNKGNTRVDIQDVSILDPSDLDWMGSPVPNSVIDEEITLDVCFGDDNISEVICENGNEVMAAPRNCLIITAQYWNHPAIIDAMNNKPPITIR